MSVISDGVYPISLRLISGRPESTMKIATRFAVPVLVVVAAVAGAEQQAGPVSIDTLMATPFPTDLVAAPTGGRIAWVSSNSGVHNILVAEPGPPAPGTGGRPDHKWRAATTYKGD